MKGTEGKEEIIKEAVRQQQHRGVEDYQGINRPEMGVKDRVGE